MARIGSTLHQPTTLSLRLMGGALASKLFRWPTARQLRTLTHLMLSGACLLVGLCGCQRNPYAPGAYYGAPYASQYPGAPSGMAGNPAMMGNPAQLAELERRIQQLDMDNRQLTTQLAQSQQRWQVADQRAALLQQQLLVATNQANQARLAQQELDAQARGLQASINSRGGATLRPNVSSTPNPPPGTIGSPSQFGSVPVPGAQSGTSGYAMNPGSVAGLQGGWNAPQLGSLAAAGSMPPLSNIQVPGAIVQMDGQALRIRVPADQLFLSGSPQLNANAYQVLDRVSDVIFRYFPRQRVAIEAHTDTGNSGMSPSNQFQLATAQAQAVMDQLTRRNSIPARQLAIIGHGPNFPRADNQSAAGRAENRRIEFVIAPDPY